MNARGLLQPWLAFIGLFAAVSLPLDSLDPERMLPREGPLAWVVIVAMAAALVAVIRAERSGLAGVLLAIAAALGGWFTLQLLPSVAGHAGPAFWALFLTSWLLAWCLVSVLAAIPRQTGFDGAFLRIVVPLIFGVWLLIIWEVIVLAFKVPFVLIPPPSAIGAKLITSIPILAADFRQTFLKAVIAGYAIGCASGFLVAILIDRVPFLQRGLLPIGNLVSALPIVGIAPIMVMWFGFDWPSKAAVVVVSTFFPMLVNTVTGLAASQPMSRDLMRTYAANYWQTLFKLRLPEAMPFIFNALKINSTLALIAAIVAEFFGTPIVGMGFRISTEVGRMNIDMVWAEIAVAALAGSVFYGVVALIERAATFWHPSFRT
ncbi:ABC transporter permease [Kaistia dalseonensis]|uniref:NitT/TauT family transport system permease protein n=1 Tax=Kaistia dalseonensis TaxID=410840 RepID=A0ABU0HDJ7_9HYPH|nr:ABC transporter permease [Kaistia dalseonensis]MCX5497746.1 ABC transporter permease [Kaistia dalseonensis]MDQ0440390.1 NitT/TauT family transport system permease protein [Kaistia dalseonensis]